MAAIYESGFELLPHAPYSPNIAPFDFHLFPHFKKSLSGIHFRSDEEVFWIVFDFYLLKIMDQRTCIKFCVKNGIKCADAFRMLTVAYGEATLDRSNVYRCYKMFSEGREDVNDEERAGRPSTSTTDEKNNEVEKMILANHRITVREVAEDLNISIGSCHSIFINELGMRGVAAKFVPKLLNCDQKQHRMNIANEMLDSVRDDPNLLQRVITGDEAWVYGYDVETKAQSSQWKLPHEPRPKKARQVRSNVKVLLTDSDNAAEYLNTEFKEYLLEEGIRHQLSVEYSPQQNGVAERTNRTLVEMTRCFIIQANLPDPLWAELVHTSTYIRNRCPRTNESRTPHEIFTGRKPTVSHLRMIGCKCFAVDNRPRRGKFAPRSEEYRLVGYSPESKAYRLWKPGTNMMIKSRDVRFLESENSTLRNDVVQIEAIPQKKEDISLEEESLQDDEKTSPGTDSEFLSETSERTEVISQRGRGRPRILRTGKPGRPRKEYVEANLSKDFRQNTSSPDPKDLDQDLSRSSIHQPRRMLRISSPRV
ncbi:hypothetical protein LAZ67_6003031 [Cordylochernes scorpioides]|uniref:Integrase catalytic domain-containing protein n=1 Tax=Cordylochernes scorpioides TaxID=51811 RepID=A0ABY6KK90_9ARAC|nr:hypothetical protein LAZ67_6003031 [Cordylochernes scorpioides]